jgi:hypothetical protein
VDKQLAVRLLGEAVLAKWGDLDQPAQERLFEAAVAAGLPDTSVRAELAKLLHDLHPRTKDPESGRPCGRPATQRRP